MSIPNVTSNAQAQPTFCRSEAKAKRSAGAPCYAAVARAPDGTKTLTVFEEDATASVELSAAQAKQIAELLIE